MVQPLNRRSKAKPPLTFLSHLLSFAFGIAICHLLNREDCYDVATKEIAKQPLVQRETVQVDSNAAPTVAALRLTQQVKAVADVSSKEKNFYEIGLTTGTDKVLGAKNLVACLKDDNACGQPEHVKEECRPFGHFYHTMYQKYLGSYSTSDADPFQFLEVGFFWGSGYDLYREFLPRGECHSIEIACLPPGPREEGKWPVEWGNSALNNPRYQQYLDENRLHCGDGSDVNFLHAVWLNEMKRPDSPPLKVVIDDASHLAEHMVQTVLYWLPRIEPGGLLFVEDVQPTAEANPFHTQFLPQIMHDLHYCGNKENPAEDEACFPTLMGMIQSIHCEMHICVFERNMKPAKEPSLEESKLPPNALDMKQCKSTLKGHW